MLNIVLVFVAIIAIGTAIYFFIQNKQVKRNMELGALQSNRRMYELAILKELGDKVGYSLNIVQIIDIITGSLYQFLEYSAVAYMLLSGDKLIFKARLERSVSRDFINQLRNLAFKALSSELNRDLSQVNIVESITGAVVVDEVREGIGSSFNIPLVMGEQGVVGVLAIAHTKTGQYKQEDITILHKITQQASSAVARLQGVVGREQRKLSSMVESLAEGVIMTDKSLNLVVVNPAAKDIASLKKDQKVTMLDLIEIFAGKFDIKGRLDESVKLDRVVILDEILINDHFYKIIVSPVRMSAGSEPGSVLGAVVLFHDVTHEKEVERLREDFTSMIVHDLRAPLTNIRVTSDLLLKRGAGLSKEQVSTSLKLLKTSSSNMLGIINDLLDVAKLEAGKFTVEKKLGRLQDVVDRVVGEFRIQADEKGLVLKSEFDEGINPFQLDEARIAQVLTNLVSNAVKFTNIGEVVISVKPMEAEVLVSVRDTGIGIPKEQQRQLFSKFKQVSTGVSRRAGTGLGLAIAKGIVEAHGGKVWVKSVPGKGTEFSFTLPRSQQA